MIPLPIVFIHTGYSSYLEFTLRQAKYSNPGSEIILIGDEANDRFDFVTHVNMKDYFLSTTKFTKIYQHYSTNSHDYEIFCFQRWFVLEEYLLQKKHEEVFVCDSDVLLYSSIQQVKEECFYDADCAFMIMNNGNSSSAGIAYWKINTLSAFCELITKNYKSKEKLQEYANLYHSLKIGGVCDMILAHEFYLSNKDKININNLLAINNNAVFDNNINTPFISATEQYNFRLNRKQFDWINKIPYCKNLTLNRDIKFHLIHFQGPAKYMITSYYTGPGFKGLWKLKFNYFILNIMAFWYKILKIRYRFAFVFNLFDKNKRYNKKL